MCAYVFKLRKHQYTRKLFPLILGRVVIVSSVKGRYPCPANSAYHITKHGLETIADCLRLEMLKFDVQVAVIEPGNFSTATGCQGEQHVSSI